MMTNPLEATVVSITSKKHKGGDGDEAFVLVLDDSPNEEAVVHPHTTA